MASAETWDFHSTGLRRLGQGANDGVFRTRGSLAAGSNEEMGWMPPLPDGIAECQFCGCSKPQKREGASVEKATIIGVDLGKHVFQVHGAAADGTVLFRKKLTRLQFHRFMAEQPACLVAMEACGGAHPNFLAHRGGIHRRRFDVRPSCCATRPSEQFLRGR
jgi:hypothetical protein